MKVILYIGHHKVGSTALQIFLAQNWLRLMQHGILYPAVESRGFANNLTKALHSRETAGDLHVNIREPHSALAYRMMSEVSDRKVPAQFKHLPGSGQMVQALRNQVDWLKPKAVILCSEAFANFGQVDPGLIKRLRNTFPKAEIEIYCALRRPDDYLISWHGQRLKVGEKLAPLSGEAAANYYDTIHFNFRTVVEPWLTEIPEARPILRNYADILKAGGSTEDFAQQIGIDLPEDMLPVGRANTSLPRAAMEIARRGNHELPPEAAHQLVRYLLSSEAKLAPTPNRDVEMFGAELRAEIADRFAPIHAWLSETTGQDAFFPDLGDMPEPRPVSEQDATADLLAQIDPASLPNKTLRDFIASLQRGNND